MNDLQIFTNPEFGEVRTVEINGEPWLVGKDVAAALGYKEPTKAVREKVDPEDKGVSKIDTPSGTQDMLIINESGFYSLVLSSKMPKAKRFKRWVTADVLPAIRRNGAYELAQTQQNDELDRLRAQDEYLKKWLHLLVTAKKDVEILTGNLRDVRKQRDDAKADYLAAKSNYGKWCDLCRQFEALMTDAQNRVNSCVDQLQIAALGAPLIDEILKDILPMPEVVKK